MDTQTQKQRVIIIGGGFGGIRTALSLEKTKNCEITLISELDSFEYYTGLHKLVGVSNHGIARIPLATIFKNTSVKIIQTRVTAIDSKQKTVTCRDGNQLSADYLVLAIGSQTEYFGISGLPEMSFGFKSYAEAMRLRNHVESMFTKHATTEKAESVIGLHMVIVGGGPNGVDLAGEMAVLAKKLTKDHGIIESLVTIDLIEASSRVLSMMPESVSHRVEKRLESLGVNVLCNRDLKKQSSWTLTLADMTLGAKTVVWTAGVTTNEFVKQIPGAILGKKSRIAVDEFMQMQGFQNLFCIGDVADTPYSGLAQTALYDANYAAYVIDAKIKGNEFHSYTPRPNAFNIGVGPRWSVMKIGSFTMTGIIPYVLRTVIDIKFFLSILPFREVWRLYFSR